MSAHASGPVRLRNKVKDLLERLEPADAQAVGVAPDAVAYTPLSDSDGVSEKAVRDAGSIAVTAI
jgi:hypothetical protein